MTELELHELRREKWRLDGKAIRTIEEARAFLELVGFCLLYPTRPPTLLPLFSVHGLDRTSIFPRSKGPFPIRGHSKPPT